MPGAWRTMRLLVDSDLFCKLGVGGVLLDAIAALNTEISECGCLPALPHMLRRSRLTKIYGVKQCASLIPIANKMQAVSAPEARWVDKLISAHDVDPGEAQLFAVAAQDALLVATGDKRALNALKDIEGFADALSGRIVVLESILLALCERLGTEVVRRRIRSVAETERTLAICFSNSVKDPREALESYYLSLASEIAPLTLWDGRPGRSA